MTSRIACRTIYHIQNIRGHIYLAGQILSLIGAENLCIIGVNTQYQKRISDNIAGKQKSGSKEVDFASF